MYQCDVSGSVVRRWKLARINDLALSADGGVLATVCQEKQIKLARLRDPREVPHPLPLLLGFLERHGV